jgi:hypothetical protein
MKRLWVAAALAPLSFAATATPSNVRADTTVSTGTSAPLETSLAGNVTISSGGSISPTASGAAVTVNSNANVTNSGSISYSGVGNATAILVDTASGEITSAIVSSGTITVSETTTGDSTNQSISTGPFANGANRFGIEVSGANLFNGSITNTGTITIIGENSAAIAIGAEMTGDLVQTGTITVTGGTPTYSGNSTVTNSGSISYGVHATAAIEGNVNIGGTVSATGENATGVALNAVGGGVTVDGAITTTGYRSTTAPTDPTILAKLNPDQTLQGGSALEIGGSVGSGVTIAAAVVATGNTSAVPEGSLTTYGSAPALQIGGVGAIAMGANSNGYSLENDGAISSLGEYPDVAATAIQIGGDNTLEVSVSGVVSGGAFGNVSLSGGIDNTGSIIATSEEHTAYAADSIAVKIGAGASVASLTNSATITASASSDASVPTGNTSNPYTPETGVTGKTVPITVAAIEVQQGGALTTLNNSGVITAAITGIPTASNYTAAGGVEGQAVAILDASGALTQVTNTNTIAASITPIVYGQSVSTTNADVVAMYLGNGNNSITVTQDPYVAGNTSGNSTGNTTGNVTPSITGDIIFGRLDGSSLGNESLDIETGTVLGNVAFNGVGNNSLTVNGNATVTGALTQSASGSLAINVESGTLDMTAPTSNTIAALDSGTTQQITLSTLHIGKGGQIIFTIDPTAANATAAQFNVTGTATLDQGSELGVSLMSKLTQSETYTLIHAGALVGNASTTSLIGTLPFLYNGVVTETATDVDLTVSLKTAKELKLNPSEASAFSAVYSQMSEDAEVEQLVLSQTTQTGFHSVYNQFLPDYAGGPFEAMASAQREIARAQADPPEKLQTDETRGWVQEIGFDDSRSGNDVANGYQARGFGVAAGAEQARGDSAIGVSAAIVSSGVNEATQAPDASLSVLAIEGGAYWRAGGEGLNASASINGGYVSLGSHRLLLNQTSTGEVSLLRDAESAWSGAVGSADFGIAYQMTFGRFYMRPELSADYIALYETAHSEAGGGPALDLAINSRMSKEGSAVGDVVFGWNFGDALIWRPELTLGWRQIITGGPDATVAKFLSGGQSFTLTPDLSDRGGLLARLGIRATGTYADVSADAGGEFRNGYQSYAARAVARFLF